LGVYNRLLKASPVQALGSQEVEAARRFRHLAHWR